MKERVPRGQPFRFRKYRGASGNTHAFADVVPTVVRGAAPACPLGTTVMMNGGELPEKVS